MKEPTEEEKAFCRHLQEQCNRFREPQNVIGKGYLRYFQDQSACLRVDIPPRLRDAIDKWAPLVRRYRFIDDLQNDDTGPDREDHVADGKIAEIAAYAMLPHVSMGVEYEIMGVDIDFNLYAPNKCQFGPDIGKHIHVKAYRDCSSCPVSFLIHRNDPVYKCEDGEFTSLDIVIFTLLFTKHQVKILGFSSVQDLKGLAQPTKTKAAGSRKDCWYMYEEHDEKRNIHAPGIEHLVRPILLLPEYVAAVKANGR